MERLKELIDKLNPERGIKAEKIEWENEEGLEVPALSVTCKGSDVLIVEKVKVEIKTIAKSRFVDGYRVLRIVGNYDYDTGYEDINYVEVSTVRGAGNAIVELVSRFAICDVRDELEYIESLESQKLAEEYQKEMGRA